MTVLHRPLRQKTIGILGGSSNVATGEYYKFLNQAVNRRVGGWDIAETLISGMNFGNIESFVRAGDWDALAAYMDGKVAGLVAGGADVLLCVSNTLHAPLEAIVANHDIPLIHIADPTGVTIRDAGLSRVALFGTRPVMEMDYIRDRYRDKFGLEIVVPTLDEMADIDRIIFDELVRGDIRDASRQTYLEIARRLARDEGAQGLILGCTEIFLLLRPDDAPDLPMFNTTELHCEAAVRVALDG
ncbi:aspartate/glutamate racemase family protein [Jannaschia donghaensis]|uniref:Aspartate racemase n=1 Tax=Jannaschia donghaensis TaxID=420998 RepID=A0A0M6YG87_9RHOB|nr:amino acid racemase [Jannaschia donghaensis]CTQ48287.1 Aspartate racemase [Jannaschia donghaensis]